MFNFVITILALVAVFIFSINKFAKHIKFITHGKLKSILETITLTPLRGVVSGTIFTSIIQSSTATTVILISFINAGFISFEKSIAVILGANIGTTITSQLVAIRLTEIAPIFVILGFAINYFGRNYKSWGKPIFYFGLMFLSLSLISAYLNVFQSNQKVIELFSHLSNFWLAVLAGLIFTAIIQSSSATSAIALVLAGNSLLSFDQAFGILIGANIGTTFTAIIASLFMNISTKKAAFAHLLFNLFALILFVLIRAPFEAFIKFLGGNTQQQLANGHMLFNIIPVLLLLPFLKYFTALVERAFSLGKQVGSDLVP